MDSHGSLTVKYKKNCYRPHKSCIFCQILSMFMLYLLYLCVIIDMR